MGVAVGRKVAIGGVGGGVGVVAGGDEEEDHATASWDVQAS